MVYTVFPHNVQHSTSSFFLLNAHNLSPFPFLYVQVSANYSLQAQSSLLPVFVNEVLPGHSHVHNLCIACSYLCSNTAVLSSCNRILTACKAGNIYYLTLKRQNKTKLANPCLFLVRKEICPLDLFHQTTHCLPPHLIKSASVTIVKSFEKYSSYNRISVKEVSGVS